MEKTKKESYLTISPVLKKALYENSEKDIKFDIFKNSDSQINRECAKYIPLRHVKPNMGPEDIQLSIDDKQLSYKNLKCACGKRSPKGGYHLLLTPKNKIMVVAKVCYTHIQEGKKEHTKKIKQRMKRYYKKKYEAYCNNLNYNFSLEEFLSWAKGNHYFCQKCLSYWDWSFSCDRSICFKCQNLLDKVSK